MLMMFAMDTGTEVYKYVNGGCPFVSLQLSREGYCKAFADAAVADMLQRMRKGDILFLPSLRLNRFADQNDQKDETVAWDEHVQPCRGGDAQARRRRGRDERWRLSPRAACGSSSMHQNRSCACRRFVASTGSTRTIRCARPG